ncbi:unnamed protein product [Phytomonas sp. Hart1]|nr:unnamed protein product [Phytomonas sp. Hart1]|eukprot:CCW70141.1 unnamed protein product [Phytomonas sp. isolate Hart1]
MFLRGAIPALSSPHPAPSRRIANGVARKSKIGSLRAIRTVFFSQLQHPPVGGFAWPRASSCLQGFPLSHAARFLQYETSAANFDTQVLQSEQAICLVYYIRNTSCSTFLRHAEELVAALNAETSTKDEKPEPSNPHDPLSAPSTKPPSEWLKLCTINADENRNLASAFSVERAKLPVSYFIMHGTIIDKVVGPIAPARLHAILGKFLVHYQSEMNVDLLARGSRASLASGGRAPPFPAAASADLLDSAATTFLNDQNFAALVGAGRIALPDDAPLLDGLRKTLQQTKKKAHRELLELHRELGMDIRRLSELEHHARYFQSAPFLAMALSAALEGLFLARCYADLGDIAKSNVVWAQQAIQKEFEPVLGEAKMRRILVLINANLVKGEIRLALATHASSPPGSSSCSDLRESVEGEPHNNNDPEGRLTNPPQEEKAIWEANAADLRELLAVIDHHVDSRTVGEGFPDDVVETLLTKLKDDVKWSKVSGSSPSSSSSSLELLKSLTRRLATERVEHTKTVLTCIINLFASDPKGPTARSRLSSILY